jgi:hypothetical protein
VPVSFDPWWMLLELLTGGIGFVLFTYGRKQQRLPYLVSGILFMAYPFVVTSIVGLLAGGLVLAAGTWWTVRLGW